MNITYYIDQLKDITDLFSCLPMEVKNGEYLKHFVNVRTLLHKLTEEFKNGNFDTTYDVWNIRKIEIQSVIDQANLFITMLGGKTNEEIDWDEIEEVVI